MRMRMRMRMRFGCRCRSRWDAKATGDTIAKIAKNSKGKSSFSSVFFVSFAIFAGAFETVCIRAGPELAPAWAGARAN